MDTLDTLPTQLAIDLDHARGAGEWLDNIRDKSRTEVEKGRWFENLFAKVVRSEAEFEVQDIWRWQDWPQQEALIGLVSQGIGVDLVARHEDGTWIAIQCKCYEPSRRISRDDVRNFITGSQHPVYGLRWIVTTCRWGPVAEALIKGTNIRRIDFLEYRNVLVDEKIERPEREPFPLQYEAIADTLEGLANHDRGRLIMACGTGKTFTALRIAEQQVPDNAAILFLAPGDYAFLVEAVDVVDDPPSELFLDDPDQGSKYRVLWNETCDHNLVIISAIYIEFSGCISHLIRVSL